MTKRYKKRANFTLFLGILFVGAPAFCLAQANSLDLAIVNIKSIIKSLTYLAYLLVFLAFFWGLAKYLATSSEEKREQALSMMVISITIIFVMSSIWGIVRLAQNTLNIDNSSPEKVDFPKVYPNVWDSWDKNFIGI